MMISRRQNGWTARYMAASGSNSERDAEPQIGSIDSSSQDANSLEKLRNARKKRLARIKADIAAGKYDSDELLDAALERMIDRTRFDEDDTSQSPDEEES